MKNTFGLLLWLSTGLAIAGAAVVLGAPAWLTLAALSDSQNLTGEGRTNV